MRVMKDSGVEWIGDIPREWETRQIKYALENHSGGAWGANKGESERDCICVRVADFDYSHLSVNYSEVMTVRSYQQKTICDSALKSGDILLEKSGGGEITPVGRSVLFSSEREMMCANFIEWLRPNFSIQPQFLNYWLSAAYSNGYSKRNVKQTTGIQNLDIPAFLSEKVLVPSGEEQQRISHYLDTKCAEIDALIAAKEKTNALLKERRQSIIYEAVTKGLDPTVPMKDSGIEWIGEIPEGWSVLPLKHCIKSIESGTSVNAEDRPCQSDEKGVLKTSCVYSGTFDSSENKAVLDSEYSRLSCPVKKNTVIVSRMNTSDLVGACGYVDSDYNNIFLPDRLWMVSFKDMCIAKYMWYFLSSRYAKSYYASICTGTSGSMQNISQDQFGRFRFLLPTLTDQTALVDELDKQNAIIDALICTNDREIQKLKEYRQSLIYEAVTGKIEV